MNGFRRWNHSSRAALVLVAVGLHTTWFSADAQEFPASPIRIFVPTAPATPPDIISRVIAAELASAEQWKVVVEDRPGAVQTIAGSEVLKQPANGTSIYAMSVPVTAAPAFLPNMPFDLSKDFAPVIKISTSYNVLGASVSAGAFGIGAGRAAKASAG
jgi:tripartite-type tricarboxylate transporter receptor subunit TctC